MHNDNTDFDFLYNLTQQTTVIVYSLIKYILIFSFVLFVFISLILSSTIVPYYLEDKTVSPVIFEVNGEKYPDMKKHQDIESSNIILETIPIEDNN